LWIERDIVMEEKKTNSVPEILKSILVQDKNVLNSRDELVTRLENEVPGALTRDMKPITNALQKNVGEIFLAADEADDEKKAEAKQMVMKILAQDGVQEKRARDVVEAFVYALNWDKKEVEIEDPVAEIEVAVAVEETESVVPETERASLNEIADIEHSWICRCGQKNSGKFCISCGESKDSLQHKTVDTEPSTWLCTCGQKNKGRYCIACGNMQGDQSSAGYSKPRMETIEVPPIPQQNPGASAYIEKTLNNNQAMGNVKTKQILIGIIILLAAGFLFFIIKEFMNPANGKASFSPIGQSTAKKIPAVESDLSLGGISLGYSLDKVHEILGTEKKQETKDKGYVYYKYDGMTVVVADGKVVSLISDGSSVKTKRELSEGVALQKVFDVYGKDYEKSEYDNQDLYEYTFTALSGEKGLLRFAVNKSDNKVKYISVRIPEKEDTAKPSGQGQAVVDVAGARTKFASYHQAISNKRLRDAYNCLSSSCQSQMGNYGSYASGYQTTISSTITNLQVVSSNENAVTLSYGLRSKDKNGNRIKVQTFTGTAVMVRENGDWRISEISAKKQGENFE